MNISGHALIVGGGSGIGEACSLAFAQEGAAGIVVADINLEAAERVVKEISASASHTSFRAKAVEVDVTSDGSVKHAIAETVTFFGRIDYCVNSAGIGVQAAKGISEADVSEFERLMSVNVTGTFLVNRHVSAAMKSQELTAVSNRNPSKRGSTRGSIVNLGSLASYIAQPHMVQYTASKHAVLGLTKNAAIDNAVHSIRVNCLCPSWVDTPMMQQAMDSVPGLKQMVERVIPMGRIACPEEVADAVIFLCSPRSSYITGSSFIVDGGTSLSGKV